MKLTMLKAKVHRAGVTQAALDYEGSCAIDDDLLTASGIREFEQIDSYNIANGERFVTYAIRAESGSGIISANVAAAHKASPGDLLIICSHAELTGAEAERFQPTLVHVDADNRITHLKNAIPPQAA